MASKKRARENNLVIIISPKSNHMSIGTPLSIPKMYSNIENTYVLEAKLQDFENSVNNKNFVCQPDHKNRPTTLLKMGSSSIPYIGSSGNTWLLVTP